MEVVVRELHLFAGIGGGILGGMLLGHRCVGAVEIDRHCRKVLEARQLEGILPKFPILEDVRAFDGRPWRGKVDVVCGGFPCQPWSSAGKRLGAADPRHLWREMARIVDEVRPRYVFAENVALAAFAEPWRDLRGMGYRVPPALRLGAWQLGAPFFRDRWWLLAADAVSGQQSQDEQEPVTWSCRAPRAGEAAPDADQVREHAVAVDGQVAGACQAGDAHGSRLAQRQGEPRDARAELSPAFGATWRAAAPRLRRLVSGSARRVDSRRARIAAVGNAQVPAVAAAAFLELLRRLEEQVSR